MLAFIDKENAMEKIEKVLYTAKTHTTGGRDGTSRSRQHRRHD
jgi:osmotically inducible protein OsmC